jgi:WD40 repeat protein
MSEQKSELEALFNAASQFKDPNQRLAFLSAVCIGQPELRFRLERLLDSQPEADAFFALPDDSPAAGPLREIATHKNPSSAAVPGEKSLCDEDLGILVGRYRLVQKIGEGGCGTVYMAEQVEPVRRRVAIKVIKLGMDTHAVIARFEAEQQALALMDHPNIARVLDAGMTANGRPFFAMELVRGIAITRYCEEHQLSTEERLKLFIQVCHALQHAHQKGIIHRDIKPSNVLVSTGETAPVPKVIDFGIAKAMAGKLTEHTLLTAAEQFIGTPAYVSPEQSDVTNLDIDTRSDIYSLGVLLYELLTGKTPLDTANLLSDGLDEMRRRIRDQESVRPSTRLKSMPGEALAATAQQRKSDGARLIQRIRGDLDWVVMKCLEKERERRYETASGLASDVQRHLDSEPVVARPPGAFYRAQKMVRRHRLAFASAAVVFAVLVLAVFVSTWQAVRANRERQRAEYSLYASEMIRAQDNVDANNFAHALKLLGRHRPAKGQVDLRGFEWRYLWSRCQGETNLPLPAVGQVWWLTFSLDGRWFVASSDQGVRVFDANTWAVVAHITKHSGPACGVFTPDGKMLVTAGKEGVYFFETEHWAELPDMALAGEVGPVAVTADGTRLVTMHSDEPYQTGNLWLKANVWDLQSRRILQTFTNVGGPPTFSPDGTLLVTDSPQGITLWPVEARSPPMRLEHSSDLLSHFSGYHHLWKAIAFSPDGKSIAVAGKGGIRIWDTASGQRVQELSGQRGDTAVAFSADGRFLAASSMDRVLLIWEVGQWEKTPRKLVGHLNEVWSLAFRPDGKAIVGGGWDRLRFWDLTLTNSTPAINPSRYQPLWVAPDGSQVISLSDDKLERWNTRTGRELFMPDFSNAPRPVNVLAVAPDGQRLLGGYTNGEVWLGDMVTGKLQRLVDRHTEPVVELRVAPDGKTFVSLGQTELFWWDFINNRVAAKSRLPEPSGARFSPSGKILGTAGHSLQLWDVSSRSRKTTPPLPVMYGGFEFSPDDSLYLIGWPPHLRRISDGQQFGEPFEGHKQSVMGATISPDGHNMASAGDDGTVRLWSMETQQELLTLRDPETTFGYPLFSADGSTLVVGRPTPGNGGIRVWHVPSFAEIEAIEKANLHNH